jgi:hypothetical protein
MMYKLHENSQYVEKIPKYFIPQDISNTDYQKFIQDVAEQGIEIVEGPDVHEPSYAELRQAAYPSLPEQQDMQYWDAINGTTIWQDTIASIKEEYPKTITGGTTIGPVPSWVQEVADNWTFNKQLREYIGAIERLSQYILSEGRPELTEDVVVGQEPVRDEDGLPTFDEERNQIFAPITQTIITQNAIEPLPEFIEITTFDPETMESVTETVRNPAIVKDEEERAAAQAVVDATPQSVKDEVENAIVEQ